MKKQFIILAALVLLLVSCAPKETAGEEEQTLPPIEVITPTPSPTPTPTPAPTPIPAPTPYEGPLNPLSGLPIDEESVNLRPLAIVINNRKISLPQLGISAADVIVEVPVEGSYTRMLAIFQDITDAGNIGSVRSARPCFVDIAQSFDSIFIHAGGSNTAYNMLTSRGISRFDGVNGPGSNMFFRDKTRERTMGYEHSMLTSTDKIAEYVGTRNYRLEHEEGYVSPLVFEEALEISGTKVTDVTVKFNSSKSTTLEYSADDGLFHASQQGGEYVDGNSGDQLAFANIIIIKTTIKVVDSEGRLNIDLKTGGDGYLAIGGQYVPIKWSRQSDSAPFVFKDEAGKEITLRSGKTYMAVISSSASAEFSE